MGKSSDRAEFVELLRKPSTELRPMAIKQRELVDTYINRSTKWWTDAYAASYKSIREEIDYQIELGDGARDETSKRRHYTSAVMKGRLGAKIFTKDGEGPGIVQAFEESAPFVQAAEAFEKVTSKAAKEAGKAVETLSDTGKSALVIALLLGGLYLVGSAGRED